MNYGPKPVVRLFVINISLFMYIIFTTGVFLWLVYGLFRGDAPIVIANSITFVLAATILTLKIKNG